MILVLDSKPIEMELEIGQPTRSHFTHWTTALSSLFNPRQVVIWAQFYTQIKGIALAIASDPR